MSTDRRDVKAYNELKKLICVFYIKYVQIYSILRACKDIKYHHGWQTRVDLLTKIILKCYPQLIKSLFCLTVQNYFL